MKANRQTTVIHLTLIITLLALTACSSAPAAPPTPAAPPPPTEDVSGLAPEAIATLRSLEKDGEVVQDHLPVSS